MEAICSRCFDYNEGTRVNPWEFVCDRCIEDEAWIQGIAAYLAGYPEYKEADGRDSN